MSDEDKFDYRFKALPASLRITTNIIAYQKKKKKWKQCTTHLINTIPRLKSLEKEMNMSRYKEVSYSTTYSSGNKNKYKTSSKPKITCQFLWKK